jgi:hypothetical protein
VFLVEVDACSSQLVAMVDMHMIESYSTRIGTSNMGSAAAVRANHADASSSEAEKDDDDGDVKGAEGDAGSSVVVDAAEVASGDDEKEAEAA